MKNSEPKNATSDPGVESSSARSELVSVVRQYSKLIDMIEPREQRESTTEAEDETNLQEETINQTKTQ